MPNENDTSAPGRVHFDDAEAERIAALIERGQQPDPDVLEALRRYRDPERRAPALEWTE